jgi:hypothetical protein
VVKMVEMWETADQNHPSQLDSVTHSLQRSLHYLLGMTVRDDETCQMRVTQENRQQEDQVKSRILNQLHPPAIFLMSTTDPVGMVLAVEVEHIGSWSSQEFCELKNMISADDLGCRTVESRSIIGMRKDHAETKEIGLQGECLCKRKRLWACALLVAAILLIVAISSGVAANNASSSASFKAGAVVGGKPSSTIPSTSSSQSQIPSLTPSYKPSDIPSKVTSKTPTSLPSTKPFPCNHLSHQRIQALRF